MQFEGVSNRGVKEIRIYNAISKFQTKYDLRLQRVLCKDLNEHMIEALVLLSRPMPWFLALHQMVHLICKILDETVPREVETKVLKPLTLFD